MIIDKVFEDSVDEAACITALYEKLVVPEDNDADDAELLDLLEEMAVTDQVNTADIKSMEDRLD